MNWLVETKFATESGYPNMIDLNSLKLLTDEQKPPQDGGILRSSIGLAKDLLRNKKIPNLVTFMGMSPTSFDANVFMCNFGDLALNKSHVYLTLNQIFSTFKSDDPIFCRPVSGWKTFSGGRLDKDRMYDRLQEDKVDKSTLCLVATAKDFENEYRFVICEKEIIGATKYLPEASPDVPDEVIRYAKEVASKINRPDDIYVLDVAVWKGNPYSLETNSFTTSGLYSMDIPYVCKKVEEFLERESND